jgi:hypothetical protein
MKKATDQVLVIPIYQQRFLLFAKEERGEELVAHELMFPSDRLREAERPSDGAVRIIEESLNLSAKKMRTLGKIYSEIDEVKQITHVFVATEFSKAKEFLSEDELVTTTDLVDSDALMGMIQKDQITSGNTLAALTLFLSKKL